MHLIHSLFTKDTFKNTSFSSWPIGDFFNLYFKGAFFTVIGLILILCCSAAMAQNRDPHAVHGSDITGISSEIIQPQTTMEAVDSPSYFLLRPDVEKAYGYSHAVKIGNSIKISGAVSMDDAGNPTAIGDFEQQMKNCYADLERILAHYGCTFDDVVVENVFTTDMPQFLQYAGYRAEIYKNNFPTGSWLGVKELAVPQFLIEIELEVHKSN